MANILLYNLDDEEFKSLKNGAEEVGLEIMTTTTDEYGNMLMVPGIPDHYAATLSDRAAANGYDAETDYDGPYIQYV